MKGLSRHKKNRQAECLCSLTPLALFVITLCATGDVLAEEKKAAPQEIAKNVEFDPSFLNVDAPSKVDLSRFANGSAVLPGTYQVDMYVNNVQVGSR